MIQNKIDINQMRNMKNKKILLLRANFKIQRRNVCPPFGLDFFSFCLKKQDIENDICDMMIDDVDAFMYQKRYDIVIIECFSFDMVKVLNLINRIKQDNDGMKIFSTGNFNPELEEIDHIFSFDEISLFKKLEVESDSEDMFGIWRLNKSLEKKYTILYPVKIYEEVDWRIVITGIGCTNRCYFCSGNIRNAPRERFRAREIDTVIEELKELKKQGVDHITFNDDNLFKDKKYSERLFQNIIDENIGIKWNGHARADQICDERFVRLLKKSGCVLLRIGMETADEKLLKRINKGEDYLKKLKKATRLLKQNNIDYLLLIILGLPDDKIKNIFKTMAFVMKVNPFLIQLHNFVPYEDSEFGKEFGVDNDSYHYQASERSYAKYSAKTQNLLFVLFYFLFIVLKLFTLDVFRYIRFFYHNPKKLKHILRP